MTHRLFHYITSWQAETFTLATIESFKKKLLEEAKELNQATDEHHTLEELADCFIICFAIAKKMNYDYYQIEAAMLQKHLINKQRHWYFDEANNVYKHLKFVHHVANKIDTPIDIEPTLINIGTNIKNLVAVPFNKAYEEINYRDVFDYAQIALSNRQFIITGWCLSNTQTNNQTS